MVSFLISGKFNVEGDVFENIPEDDEKDQDMQDLLDTDKTFSDTDSDLSDFAEDETKVETTKVEKHTKFGLNDVEKSDCNEETLSKIQDALGVTLDRIMIKKVKSENLKNHIEPKASFEEKKEDIDTKTDDEDEVLDISMESLIHQCALCPFKFITEDLLNQHKLDDHKVEAMEKENSFCCQTCNKNFTSKQYLKDHIGSKHNGTRFKCGYCDHLARFSANLRVHIRKYHLGQPYKMDTIKDKLHNESETSELSDAINEESPTSPTSLMRDEVESNEADEMSPTKADQVESILHETSTEESSTKQELSPAKFGPAGEGSMLKPNEIKSEVDIENINSTMDNISPGDRICQVCDRKFASKSALKDHFQSLHNGTFYHCDYCDKTTNFMQNMRRHIKTNHADKPMEYTKTLNNGRSEKIEAKFVKLDLITTLEESKEQESQNSAAETNELVSPASKYKSDYQCSDCNKVFTQKWNLDTHIATLHNGIRFQCHYCKYWVKYRHIIKRHIKAVHPNKEVIFTTSQYQSESDLQPKKSEKIETHDGICFQCNYCKFSTKHKGNVRSIY